MLPLMSDVLVLGGNGMLGHTVLKWLRHRGLAVASTGRPGTSGNHLSFEVEEESIDNILTAAGNPQYVINAIGVIKPRISDNDASSVENAIRVNALFPHALARQAAERGVSVIQIATDCVYSGTTGQYDERSPHDPLDVYGKTKSLGEASSSNVLHIRCSIIGPEAGRSTSLWEWLRNQQAAATVTGFTNHNWNGVTTLQFARVCEGIVRSGVNRSGIQHLVPADSVSKFELLRLMASAHGREDITINRGESTFEIDRTLSTINEAANFQLWEDAGYERAPTIAEMIAECAGFNS